LFLTQFQVSLHISSTFSSAFHPKISLALVGIARSLVASPGLLSVLFSLIVIPLAFSNAATNSKTLVPLPVPRLKAWKPFS